MEIQGGLSEELKQKISRSKIAIIGHEAVNLIEFAIKRMGFRDTVISTEYSNLPECDIAVCTSTMKDEYKKVLTHYKTIGVSVIGAFNFGIGACVGKPKPECPLEPG